MLESLRDKLLEGKLISTSEEFTFLFKLVTSQNAHDIVDLAWLCQPMLAMPEYKEEAANLYRNMLENKYDVVRCAALESISWGLGDCPIADTLLTEAKILLANESVQYVKDYLESL